MRDWLATHFLRSGKDLPTTSDGYKLHVILQEVQDLDRIEELFTAAGQLFATSSCARIAAMAGYAERGDITMPPV